MATYNLNLTLDYCSEWGFWEAIREIIQNGSDQEKTNPDNKFSIQYDAKKEQLILSNKESVLDRSTILMGKTSKKDNDELVGQYGEGYKVALAVLTRIGKRVVINNFRKNEKWTPILVEDKAYDGEKVVKIKVDKYIFKRTPDNNLTWTIHNVSVEDWNLISDKYLPFLDISEDEIFQGEKSSILFSKELKGKVFVNGLFVEKVKTNIEHGYNLHPSVIQLDRDRRSVEGFDLYWNSSKLLEAFAKVSTENAEYVHSLIKKESVDAQYISSSYFATQLTDTIAESFVEEHGEKAFPVTQQEEMEVIQKRFPEVKPVIVKAKEKEFLIQKEEYKDIQSFSEKFDLESFADVEPSDLLTMFLLKHKNNLSYEAVEDLEKLLEESKGWTLTDEKREEGRKVVEEQEEEISIEEKPVLVETPQVVPANDFEDDIPF